MDAKWLMVVLRLAALSMAIRPTAAQHQNTTAKETPGELWVSKNSSHCDWNQSMGPKCFYNETNQVVVVPAGLTLPNGQLEVEIHYAKTVHVYPTCISWIQVFSAGLVTTFPSEQDFYTIYRKPCRTWLRIYESQADSISHGVKDLTIINTEVNTINLVQQRDFMAINSTINTIEALSWEGYRGTIQNSTIQKISNVVAKDNWLVIGSHFGYITTDGIDFRAKEMAVTNSSISQIATNGLKIVNGAASLTNVTIDMLEASAIVVKSPSAFLVLNNVTISSAFTECIVLPDKERISIKNVTIRGVPLEISSPYLKFMDDFEVPENVSKVQVKGEREGCSATETSLTCDFSSVNESIELNAANIEGYQLVHIKNVKSLQVLSTSCNLELRLQSVNGTLPHFATETNHSKVNVTSGSIQNGGGTCEMSLSVYQSELEVISSKYISNMTLSNSTVKRLHDGAMKAFNVDNVTVIMMDSVIITGTGSKWSAFVLGSIFNVTLQAPVKAEGFLVAQKLLKGALIIDHPDATTELSKVKVSTVNRESIIVKRGTLIIKDFMAISIREGAIYVEEGAFIELHNTVTFLTSYKTISVAHKDQVKISGTTTADARKLVHVRNPPPVVDKGSDLTISTVHDSTYCTSVPFFLKVCDFSKVENASVVIDLESAQDSHRAVVRGASYVTLYPSCIEKLILLQVDEATTVNNEEACDTWLEAKGVHFHNITSGVHDVTLTGCTVDYLAPSRMLRDLDLENSVVKRIVGVEWSGYTGLFNNSHIGRVESLVASSRMVLSNTTVGEVLTQGMEVVVEGVISNSTIKSIATQGLIVKGTLRMKDVTIGKLAKTAILVQNGLLLLSNVSIESSDEMSIIATKDGGVAMQNVTVGGKKVHWRGYLADELKPDDSSLIFVNKHIEKHQGKVPTVPVPPPEEPSKATPQSSSMTKEPASGGRGISGAASDNSQGTSKQEKLDASSDSSWKWAGASVGVFSVLLLGGCIILVVKLAKPNNGRLMPIVFWRVKDDQNDLLVDDQNSPDFTETANRHAGYRTLPSTEVI